ncbi:8039_t:CDS:2 [Dentiscutata erythropus]|uniref:8039_t:CDS:1 n=1 Tax=Dentiscutata erythropus TaxID=1348616 RepID=A0A9N9IDS1_9GLOM|nr:8039_t:CDS:2 [Dentiscutata erythropus]
MEEYTQNFLEQLYTIHMPGPKGATPNDSVDTHLSYLKYCYPCSRKQAILTIQQIFRSWNQKRINSAKIIQHAVIKWLYRPGGLFMKQAKDRYYQNVEKKILFKSDNKWKLGKLLYSIHTITIRANENEPRKGNKGKEPVDSYQEIDNTIFLDVLTTSNEFIDVNTGGNNFSNTAFKWDRISKVKKEIAKRVDTTQFKLYRDSPHPVNLMKQNDIVSDYLETRTSDRIHVVVAPKQKGGN